MTSENDMCSVSESDINLIRKLSDMPLTEQPYLAVAKELGITESEVISRINHFIDNGIFRRFALIPNHRKLGIMGNTLCMAKVPERHISEIGIKISQKNEVTHCYFRRAQNISKGNPKIRINYNIYFMVHGKDVAESESKAAEIMDSMGILSYKLVSSIKEYKKTSFLI